MIPVVTPIGQMEPVARSIRSEAAHRNAVREIGPRPDRLAALAPTNQVGRPSGLGMEAEASHELGSRSSKALVLGRATAVRAFILEFGLRRNFVSERGVEHW
jgi:hypothetical protein